MPEPLPRNPFCPSSDEHTAYESRLRLEGLGCWDSVAGKEAVMFKFSPEVAARVLGYALIHSPTEGMVNEICSCDGEGEVLVGLAYLYAMCVIGMFKYPKGSVSTPMSAHSPRLSSTSHDDVTALLSQPTVSSSDAKKLALARDNYRCILSGNVDINSFDDGLTTVNEAAGERMRSTVLGHIVFGPSRADYTAGLTDVVRRKLGWATSAPAVIKRFTTVEFENESDIYRAGNTFTVTPDFYHAFDELRVSLRPLEEENDKNTYEIRTHPPNRNTLYGLPNQVTLTDATGGQIPLPNWRYFQLHDACARIAYLSGAGEVLEMLFTRDVRVLAEDGGDDHVLCLALAESVSRN